MNLVKVYFYLFATFACVQIYAQPPQLRFDHVGTKEGLSHNNVLCITRDQLGFMWFGTRIGLNKYDGYNFTIYRNNPNDTNSISNDVIGDIRPAKNGDLWIATLGGGLCRYDHFKEKFVRYQHNASIASSICSNYVNNILEDTDGTVWIGTDAGVDHLNPVSSEFTHFTSDLGNPHSLSDPLIQYILRDNQNRLWFCTSNGGLNLYNRGRGDFTRYVHSNLNPASLSSNNLYTMFQDSRQRLWIGTIDAGLELFDPATGIFRHFQNNVNNNNSLSSNTVYTISEDVRGNLWIGTENGGLNLFNYDKQSFYCYKTDAINRTSIGNNSIYSIYRDAKNNMWLGTFASGIDIVNHDKDQFLLFSHMLQDNSLSNEHVLSIMQDRAGTTWIGTDGGGLDRFNQTDGSFTHMMHQKNNPNSLCGNYVLTSCEDRAGNIWIGTWADGISVYNPSTRKFRHLRNNPLDTTSLKCNNAWYIFQDHDGDIWVATFGGGLELLNPDKKSFTHFLPNESQNEGVRRKKLVYIFQDHTGLMWICSDGCGVSLFDKKTGKFTRLKGKDVPDCLETGSIASVYEDRSQQLWLATSAGLLLYNRATGKFREFRMEEGLPDNHIYGILEDERNNLWLSTNHGISRMNMATLQFKNFGVSDGLQGNDFKTQAFCKSRSGFMYFGGNNGFNLFHPDSIRPVHFEPPTIITRFLVFNKDVPISLNDKDPSPLQSSISETHFISLPYAVSVFSFEFATLNYTDNEKKRYAYKLEGFDKVWTISESTRTATYTHLSPGTYFFKVKGLDNEGNWSKQIRSLQIEILPPFWMTWWFRCLVIMVIAGSVIGFYVVRMNSARKQRLKLQRQVDAQTVQLVLLASKEQKARKEAEAARRETEAAYAQIKLKNGELEKFAYIVSHDLQEPLRTTSGLVALFNKKYQHNFDSTGIKYLNHITDACARMKLLIRDLLDYSLIGTKTNLKEINCNTLVENMLSDIGLAVQEAGAEIRYQDLPVITGYPTEIKLLFQNLVTNAIKFRKKDISPQIRISARRLEQHWEFAFEDNGIGIDPEHHDKIFNTFQRLHDRSEYEGTGIGLSHCKKIVELHKGTIWVNGAAGTGSTFYFTLSHN